MWISKNSIKKNKTTNNAAESVSLTISNSDELETNGSANSRNISVFSPYGYSFVAPNGLEALLVSTSIGKAITGIKMGKSNIKSGEIKISNKSGAYILLKDDGSVVINGKVYPKESAKNG